MSARDVKALTDTLPDIALLIRIQLYGHCFSCVAISPSLPEAKADPCGSLPPVDHLRERAATELPNPWNKSLTAFHRDVGSIRLSRRPELVTPLLTSLSKHIAANHILTDLRLIGLKVTKEGWRTLGEGLKGSRSLEFVALSYCKITDGDMEVLSPALETLGALRKLDLSNNSLGNKSGFLIGRIVSQHSERCDSHLWSSTLRTSLPPTDSEPCLTELALANNHLDDFALFDICRVLSLDVWLRTIDLRRNHIGAEAAKELESVLRSNRSLLVVDLRETPCEKRKEVGVIICKLRKNMKIAGKSLPTHAVEVYQSRIQDLITAYPLPIPAEICSAPISLKSSPRRSSHASRSPNSTACCSPPSSLPSKSSKIDLKIAPKSASISTRSKISLSSTQVQTQASYRSPKAMKRLSQLEALVSELSILLESIGEDISPRGAIE